MLPGTAAMRRNAGFVMTLASSSTVARAFSSPGVPVKMNGGRSNAHDWDADRYSTNAGFVPVLGKSVIELLAPKRGERILDVGCGDGVLTAELMGRGCRVVGIDFAPHMVASAVEKDVDAYVMDASAIDPSFLLSKIADHNTNPTSMAAAQKSSTTTTVPEPGMHPQAGQIEGRFATPVPESAISSSGGCGYGADSEDDGPPAFDAVFTNAALHWVRAPRTVIDGARRVLRPGGRFVGEFGGHGNMAAVRVAMHAALRQRGVDPLEVDPWYFPTPHEYRRLLEKAGFIVDEVVLVPRPTALPETTGMRGWLSTFTHAFLNALPENPSSEGHDLDENGLTRDQALVIDEALTALQPALCDGGGAWTADYVRLRFKAHLPHRTDFESTLVSAE